MENDIEKQEDVTVYDGNFVETLQAQERAQIDSMVATAKKYPRNIKRSTDNAIATVSLSAESAKTCSYALPRKDQKGNDIKLTGPSVHLARILAQAFGNMRVDSRVKDITPTHVVSESVCLDLENNYGVRVEVRRSIIGKSGRYSEDMITVTANAANAIAYRNAVLAVIPKPVIDAVYNAAQNTIAGDLSDEQKLITRRKSLLDQFRDTYGATEAEILKLVGKGAIEGIKRDEIVFLIGIKQALIDGDTTADEVFGRNTNVTKTAEKLKDLADKGYKEVVAKSQEEKKSQQSQQTTKPTKGNGNLNFEGQKT